MKVKYEQSNGQHVLTISPESRSEAEQIGVFERTPGRIIDEIHIDLIYGQEELILTKPL